jgi:hypothetical protein
MTKLVKKQTESATVNVKAQMRSVGAQTKRDEKLIKDSTHVLDAATHYETLCSIARRAGEWHSTSYKKATDELYTLLADCYKGTADIRAASVSVVKQLNKLLKEKKLTFNDGTRLETKVVRVVFGNIGKRAQIYARVLVNAREQSVQSEDFVSWLETQGGVEAVRKQHNGLTPAEVKAQRVETAEKVLPLVKAQQLSNAPKADGSDYVLALVQHTNGKQRIVGFCDSVTLIKEAMSKLADAAQQEADDITRADIERDARKYRQEIAQTSAVTAKAA